MSDPKASPPSLPNQGSTNPSSGNLLASNQAEIPSDLVELGTIIDAYGIKGALKVRPFSADPVGLLNAKEVWIKHPKDPNHLRNYQVYKSRNHSGTILLELTGLTDRELVLSLKSAEILATRKSFPSLSDDEYYWSDLIGLKVLNQQSELLGSIVEMMDNGAQSVMVIEDDVKKQHLIPFVAPFVFGVHLKSSDDPKVIVDWAKDW